MNLSELENKIILADCIEILKQLETKSVDLILTDPPYGGNVVRGGGVMSKYTKSEKREPLEWDIAPKKEVFDEMFRVSKNQIIWGGNYFNLPATRCFNCWNKIDIPLTFSFSNVEYAWTSFNKNAKVFSIPTNGKGQKIHPTQKPLDLIIKQILLYSKDGDLILDPFSGSGTTAIACEKTGRRFICIEKNQDYFAKSVERLENFRKEPVLWNI